MRARITRVGKFLLTLMLLFYVASVTSQSGLLLLLIGLMGGAFAVNWNFARRNAGNVRITPPRDVQIVECEKPSEPWRIENIRKKHLEMVEITSGETMLFRIPLLPVGEVLSLVPQMVFPRRGIFRHAEITISSSAPYGLVCAQRKVAMDGQVIVFPRVYEAASPAQTGTDFISGGKFRGGRRVNSGSHFAGIRPWQTGDSFKQVHWKATARRDELMVKSFEEELGGRVTLVLDAAPGSADMIDQAVRAAASLGLATLQEGHHLELAGPGGEGPLRWAPFSDEFELLEWMAAYQPPSQREIPAVEGFWRKSVLALVGTEWREDWRILLQEVLRQNRRVHLYLPVGSKCPEIPGLERWHFDAETLWMDCGEKVVVQ